MRLSNARNTDRESSPRTCQPRSRRIEKAHRPPLTNHNRFVGIYQPCLAAFLLPSHLVLDQHPLLLRCCCSLTHNPQPQLHLLPCYVFNHVHSSLTPPPPQSPNTHNSSLLPSRFYTRYSNTPSAYHVVSRRHHALRDRFLPRNPRPRPCLRVREVLKQPPSSPPIFRFLLPFSAPRDEAPILPYPPDVRRYDPPRCRPRTASACMPIPHTYTTSIYTAESSISTPPSLATLAVLRVLLACAADPPAIPSSSSSTARRLRRCHRIIIIIAISYIVRSSLTCADALSESTGMVVLSAAISQHRGLPLLACESLDNPPPPPF